jgi:hypothetical protein
MASSKDCLPCDDIGGFKSVPVVVKSPVVKKSTAACFRKSFEWKTLPSLVAVTSKLCCFPSAATACSTMLGFPPVVFTTSCSKPEDLVKTRTDLLPAANSSWGNAKLAPTIAPARKNCRRLKMSVIWRLSSMFRFALDFVAPKTLDQMIASADGNGHHGEGRILAR